MNTQPNNYTTVLADAGKAILHPSTDNVQRTYSINSNANVPYSIGTQITFINRSAANLLITIIADTLLLCGTTNTGTRTLTQNGIAIATKVEATTWIIYGAAATKFSVLS
jgi:hypothetical protein